MSVKVDLPVPQRHRRGRDGPLDAQVVDRPGARAPRRRPAGRRRAWRSGPCPSTSAHRRAPPRRARSARRRGGSATGRRWRGRARRRAGGPGRPRRSSRDRLLRGEVRRGQRERRDVRVVVDGQRRRVAPRSWLGTQESDVLHERADGEGRRRARVLEPIARSRGPPRRAGRARGRRGRPPTAGPVAAAASRESRSASTAPASEELATSFAAAASRGLPTWRTSSASGFEDGAASRHVVGLAARQHPERARRHGRRRAEDGCVDVAAAAAEHLLRDRRGAVDRHGAGVHHAGAPTRRRPAGRARRGRHGRRRGRARPAPRPRRRLAPSPTDPPPLLVQVRTDHPVAAYLSAMARPIRPSPSTVTSSHASMLRAGATHATSADIAHIHACTRILAPWRSPDGGPS